MKKLFTMLFAFVLISAMALSQTAIGSRSNETRPNTDYKVPSITKNLYELGNPGKVADQQLSTVYLDTIRQATFSFYGHVTPVVYEPVTNTLIEAQEWRHMPNATDLYGGIYIKYSTNNGLTWSLKKTIYDQLSKLPILPSIAIINPNKTNPLDFDYVFSGPLFLPSGNSFTIQGDYWVIANGTTSPADLIPLENPVPGYSWWTTKATANIVKGNEIFYNSGILTNSTGYQYGAYGNSAFNMSGGEFTQNIPPQWDVTKFRPSTDLERSYNDLFYTDADNQGGVYVGVKNMFADDVDNRVPAVSKSTDGGLTWSEFDRMPATLITNYIGVYGGDVAKSAILAYESDGFVVWAPDNFSFIVRMAIGTSANQYTFHMVEAFKKGGAWGIRKIGDFSGYNLLTVTNVSRTTVWKDSVQASRLGNEAQIVRTADSKYLVAKWVDYNGDTMRVMPPIIMNEVDTIGVINTTDVFMSYRDVNSPDWSAPTNVTQTKDIDKCTFLPLIIKDLANVPLFNLATFRSTNPDPNNPRNQYPNAALQLLYDTWQGVGFTNINLLGSDVKEEKYNFNVNNIYPNPASDAAELTLNLNASDNVHVEVFDILGNKMTDVMNSVLGQGLNGVNINVSSFVDGNYYVRITVGGKSITKSMTVIH